MLDSALQKFKSLFDSFSLARLPDARSLSPVFAESVSFKGTFDKEVTLKSVAAVVDYFSKPACKNAQQSIKICDSISKGDVHLVNVVFKGSSHEDFPARLYIETDKAGKIAVFESRPRNDNMLDWKTFRQS